MKKLTLEDATRRWVSEWNHIPQNLIMKAYPNLEEIEVLATEYQCSNCDSTEFTKKGECTNCNETEKEYIYVLPMWGYMFSFKDSLDEEWMRDNVEEIAKLGIWVYESDDIGIFFGIDGAGYDFYEAHWIPLYKLRGLEWHNTDKE